MELTHINSKGRAHMVDVNKKSETIREAVAAGSIYMKSEILLKIFERKEELK